MERNTWSGRFAVVLKYSSRKVCDPLSATNTGAGPSTLVVSGHEGNLRRRTHQDATLFPSRARSPWSSTAALLDTAMKIEQSFELKLKFRRPGVLSSYELS
jgi:hypothetical protein